MGWFKKRGKEKRKETAQETPPLPELPSLPELEEIEESKEDGSISQLPSFPIDNSVIERFSQDTIKEAVSGKKESDEKVEADDFVLPEEQMMQKPLKVPLTREVSFPKEIPLTREITKAPASKIYGIPLTKSSEIPEQFKEAAIRVKMAEPVFVRIDKFEEALGTFENTKAKINEIKTLLRDIRRLKEEEEKELQTWENELQMIKDQIDKIDKDIFSKIE